MKTRQFHCVWATVIFLVVVTVRLLPGVEPEINFEREALGSVEPLSEVPVVVIGSSLMMYAVPPFGSRKNSLLGDSREHVRLALSSITERQTIELLKRVLASPAERVFVEIHPFCFDFAFQTRRDGILQQTRLHDLVDRIRTSSVHSRRELGRRSGWSSDTQDQHSIKETITHEPTRLDEAFHIESHSLTQVYPLRLRTPRHLGKLEELLELAKERQIEIVLVAPPRSQTTLEYLGNESAEALERHIQDVAEQLERPLFRPARCWPDEYFIDQAHRLQILLIRTCFVRSQTMSTRSESRHSTDW